MNQESRNGPAAAVINAATARPLPKPASDSPSKEKCICAKGEVEIIEPTPLPAVVRANESANMGERHFTCYRVAVRYFFLAASRDWRATG
jgi:hypothetical protein